MLKIQFKDRHREPIWVVDNHYTIGTDANCNLQLSDSTLSPKHALLETRDNSLYLKALASHPPCTINGQVTETGEVRPGDTVTIGKTELLILHPHESISQPALADEMVPKWSLIASSSWLTGQEFSLKKSKMLIGRGSQCDIVIPGTHLSRQHAEIVSQGNQLLVRDLASANGTFVNNKRVTEAIVNAGDEVRFDIYPFKVKGPNTDHNKTRVRSRAKAPNNADLTNGAAAATASNDAASAQPKQWKTRPTSPGNREEPVTATHSRLIPLLSLLLGAAMLAALVYLGLI